MTHSYKLQHKSDYNGSCLIFIWLSVTMVTSHNGDDGHTTIRSMNQIVTFLPSRSMNLTGRNSNVHNTPLTNKSRYPRLNPCNYNFLKINLKYCKTVDKKRMTHIADLTSRV
ncbi:hypothetical protein HanRHA438_Chr04g0172271 [Helianthus annuus]|nr:hypothetical protein HanRHA438_Chr04g0172271 [Helianthus annuus]